MSENVAETTDSSEEFASFTEGDREIAYRSEGEAAGTAAPGERQAIIAPGMATGRRKEAVARVRIVPGTGQWSLNGRALEDYFPSKIHQQLVNEPFVVAGVEGAYDVIARVHGGGPSDRKSVV